MSRDRKAGDLFGHFLTELPIPETRLLPGKLADSNGEWKTRVHAAWVRVLGALVKQIAGLQSPACSKRRACNLSDTIDTQRAL